MERTPRKTKPEDEAVAWLCECGALESADDHVPEPLYECSDCGAKYTRENSADGGSNRCPDCNKFGAKLTDHGCRECGEDEMTPLMPHPAFGK